MESGQSGFVHRVREEEDGKMVRQVLKNRFRFSRRMFRRIRQGEGVMVNGEPVYLTSRVRAGDEVQVPVPTDEGEGIEPQPIPIDVVHEDDDLIILDKPPGIVVHPTRGYKDGTLANALAHFWRERGEFHLVRPVTRLDKNTSGLIVFAKHAHAHGFLSKEMDRRRYKREYLALVQGRMEQRSGMMDGPIGRSKEFPARRRVTAEGVHAVTHFHVLRTFPEASLLRLSLETGRTHQIRVHLSHEGHPIIGDDLYGGKGGVVDLDRQALHATSLTLVHPRDGREYHFESPLPPDMAGLLHDLEGRLED
ncbi:RluA family pseudouridine synthase [Salinithrix halophila]|uniref:Pseudouridine synthase n=1 Tax=Salinithrix halophila TaxID=1485204 RepID=A0ABV8JBA5_9BACL